MTINIKEVAPRTFAWQEKRKFLFFSYYKTTMLVNAKSYDEIFDMIREVAKEKGVRVIDLK
jgi:hypothetical protein